MASVHARYLHLPVLEPQGDVREDKACSSDMGGSNTMGCFSLRVTIANAV
jgi:hypothetical protein